MKRKGLFLTVLQCGGYVALFYACQIAASLLGGAVILGNVIDQGFTGEEAQRMYELGYYRLTYEILALSAVFFFGVVTLIKRKHFFSDLGMRKAQVSEGFAGLFLGLGAYFVTSMILPIILAMIPAVNQSQESYMETYNDIMASHPALWAEMLYACVLAPLVEETLCRGIILNKMKQFMAPFWAILISGSVFGFFHGNSYQITFSLPLGLLLGWVAHKSGSLWPSVLLHAGFNASNYLIRLGLYLGYSETEEAFAVISLVGLMICALALPMGVLLWKVGAGKRTAEGLFDRPAAPEPDFRVTETVFKPHAQNPAFYQNYAQGEAMAAPEFLIVGLGNPGEKYVANRHNCGFMALDYIALRLGTSIQSIRFRSLTAEVMMDGKKVLLLKPQTFMNLSGEAVREAAAFYKIPPEKILVIFDDINFAPGVFRIRPSGSAGGHNGIKSVISCLSSDAFPRIKMGVGSVPPGWELMNWVLSNPSKEDTDKIIASMEDVYASARHFVNGTLERAASLYSGKRHGE